MIFEVETKAKFLPFITCSHELFDAWKLLEFRFVSPHVNLTTLDIIDDELDEFGEALVGLIEGSMQMEQLDWRCWRVSVSARTFRDLLLELPRTFLPPT